jgi:hypothetical protein
MQERINRLADAHEARQRADEAAARHQRRLDEEPITLPPDLSEKQTLAPPSAVGDDETHHPGGELHSVDPKDEPSPSAVGEDNEGDLPRELLEGVPPAPSTYPDPELPKPPVVSQPISVSLNQE